MGLLVPLRPPDDELVRHEGHEEEDVDGEVDHLSVHQRHWGHAEGRHVRQTLLPLDQSLNDVVLTILVNIFLLGEDADAPHDWPPPLVLQPRGLAPSEQPTLDKGVEVGISAPQPLRDLPDAEGVGEQRMSDHGVPHLLRLLGLLPHDDASPLPDEGQQVHGEAVWPGQLAALLPPPPDDQMDVETKKKSDRDAGRLLPGNTTSLNLFKIRRSSIYRDQSISFSNWIC